MISLELLVPGNIQTSSIDGRALGFHVDPMGLSDRGPSLWNDLIREQGEWVLIHLFDRNFIGNEKIRWLYEDVDEEDWRRFKLKEALSQDFIHLLRQTLSASPIGRIWILTDAQFGPPAKRYVAKTFPQFESLYSRYGLRINGALPITA